MKFMTRWLGYRHIDAVLKVKARRDICSTSELDLKAKAMGNDHADRGAKNALAAHPPMGEEFDSKVGWLVDRAKRICKVITEVLPLLPPLKNPRQGCLPRSGPGSPGFMGGSILGFFQGASGGVRCASTSRTLRYVVASKGNQKCPGKQCGFETVSFS